MKMELLAQELISEDQLPGVIIHQVTHETSPIFSPVAIPGLALQRVYFSDETVLLMLLHSQGSPDAFAQS
jgi:hypothetical protein